MWRRPLLHGMLAVTAALIWFSPGSIAGAHDDHVVSTAALLRAGVGPGREPVPTGYAGTVRVPQDFDTIQAAVDHAQPGGMVLIAPGIYEESVTVTTPYLTIRGVDRDRTIIDGGSQRADGVQVFEADGVAIENLTSRHNLVNGISWYGVHGYWGRYLTAYDNGHSGIVAYDSDYGQLDHSYASGSPDSGFSVGRCAPCRAVVTDVVAQDNAAGFSGANASDVAIVNSEWTNNMSGIAPNTQDAQADAPQRNLLIAGNYIHDNGNPAAPALALTYPSFGMGVVVAGGVDNLITANLIEDQPTYGIAVVPILDRNLWPTAGNEVRDNVVRRSGLADLALAAPSAGGDCFTGNDLSTSEPPAIEALYPCTGLRAFPGGGGSLASSMEALVRSIDARDGYRIRPVDEISSTPGPTVSKELTVMGLPLATSWWGLLIGLYGYVLPFVLYAAWVAIALWDLIRQESQPLPHRTRWMLVVLVVPFIGPLLYFAFGRSPIPRQLRIMLTAGGVAIYAAFVLLGVVAGR